MALAMIVILQLMQSQRPLYCLVYSDLKRNHIHFKESRKGNSTKYIKQSNKKDLAKYFVKNDATLKVLTAYVNALIFEQSD